MSGSKRWICPSGWEALSLGNSGLGDTLNPGTRWCSGLGGKRRMELGKAQRQKLGDTQNKGAWGGRSVGQHEHGPSVFWICADRLCRAGTGRHGDGRTKDGKSSHLDLPVQHRRHGALCPARGVAFSCHGGKWEVGRKCDRAVCAGKVLSCRRAGVGSRRGRRRGMWLEADGERRGTVIGQTPPWARGFLLILLHTPRGNPLRQQPDGASRRRCRRKGLCDVWQGNCRALQPSPRG